MAGWPDFPSNNPGLDLRSNLDDKVEARTKTDLGDTESDGGIIDTQR